MKKLLVLSILCLLISSAGAQTWFDGTFDQALTAAKSKGKMVLVDFFSDG